MIKLRSFKNTFAQYGILHDNLEFEIIEDHLNMEQIRVMQGVFDIVNDQVFAFIWQDETDSLYWSKQFIKLPVGYIVEFEQFSNNTNLIQFIKDGISLFKLEYVQMNYGEINRIGYTEDQADYNFGLWLYNRYKRNVSEESNS